MYCIGGEEDQSLICLQPPELEPDQQTPDLEPKHSQAR